MIGALEYQAWLNNPRSKRVVLYEFAGLRLSNVAYRAWINGVPHPYLPVVASPLAVKNALGAALAVGALELINTGMLDELVGQVLHGEAITARWGDPMWAYGDFPVVFRGVIDSLYPTSRSITTLTLYDQNYLLERQLLSARAGVSEELIPLVLGEVFNVPALQVSALALRYQVSQTPCQIMRVRDGGVPIPFTDEGNGLFTLSLPPARELRADVVESHQSPAQIASYLAAQAGIESVSRYAFSPFQEQLKCGLWLGGNDTVNAALTSLLEPLSVYHRVGLLGDLELVHINHTGAADYELSPSQVIADSIRFGQPIQPASQINLHWRHNWSPLADSGLALRLDPANASPADLELADLLVHEFRTKTANTTYSSGFFSAVDYHTCLMDEAQAQAELERRTLSAGVLRRLLSFDALAPGMAIEVGDRVRIQYPRFGLDVGVVGTVVGTDKRFGNSNKINVEMVL